MKILGIWVGLVIALSIALLSQQAAPIVYAQPAGWIEDVDARTRSSKSFYDPSRPGLGLWEGSVGKIHYDGPNWKDIDNTLAPSLANVPTLGLVDIEMVTDDYEFYALQTLNTVPLWFYRNKTAPDTFITFTPPVAIQWTNDLDQIEQISTLQSVAGAVMENRLHWQDAYGPGINLTLSAQAGRLAKALTLETMPPAPAQYILDGGNPALELRFIFDTPSGPSAPEIWVDGVLWDQTARTETVGVVEFRVGGNTIFAFAEPTAFDSGFSVASPSFLFTKQGPNLRVAIRVPLSFLETATYPVVIDPTINEQVAAGSDDGRGWPTMRDTDTRQWVGEWDAANYSLWTRWTAINIDQGTTITGANITYTGYNPCGTLCGSADADFQTNIWFNDVDDAAVPTTQGEYDSLVKTSASVEWDSFSFSNDEEVSPPDIQAIVQEIINRPGWVANNDMMVIHEADVPPTDQFLAAFWAYEGSPAKAAQLSIDYVAWENTAPSITNKITADTGAVNVAYSRSFTATDPDTNQTLQWELNTTDAPFTITVWNGGNRTTWVNATPDTTGTFYINVTVGDNSTTGNATDYVNYTLTVSELGADINVFYIGVIGLIILIVLGIVYNPIFHVPAGIGGIFLSFVVYEVTSNLGITAMFWLLSVSLILIGALHIRENLRGG